MPKARTAGDGMESAHDSIEARKNVDQTNKNALPGRLIQIYPTNIIRKERKKSQLYAKSPKFVPYEPYPAAVKPMVPQKMSVGSKKSKNNMDINTLISQMSQMDTKISEYKPRAKLRSASEKSMNENTNCAENEELKNKIEAMTQENEDLKEQLKQQAQVNKELKTMLVASMGEDLETQVQSLNEDKKHLADALLNSAQHLSTHQEQTEWLAGQCEVWRSKFLASSLMVEELATWKKVLNQRTEELQQAVKQMLDERCRARDMMINTYKNLSSLHDKWLENITLSQCSGSKSLYNRPIGNLNLSTTTPQTTNILDLSLLNLKLSENISSNCVKQDISHLHKLPMSTDGEKHVENIMATPLEVKRVNEVPVNALVSHAYTSGNISKPIASCVHCNGRVQLL